MPLYTAAALLGAFLIFLVQPMAAKVALPTLGGAPFVWNGCMVFFQAALLCGYLYAHALTRLKKPAAQALIHVALLAATLAFAFPLTFAYTGLNPAHAPLPWLLTMLAFSVGAPFFILSATAPLTQAWFAASRPGANPYALYAASNIGSFGALLAYPALVEPNFPLSAQANLLYGGFALMLGLFALLGWRLVKTAGRGAAHAQETPVAAIPPRTLARWLVLSFIPAGLLYAVTGYITTDIASVPLFWVAPLALYLLTFVLVFKNRPPRLETWRILHRLGAPLMAIAALLPQAFPAPFLLAHLLIFFACAMMCHSRLAALKPPPAQLTAFYLVMSAGGVLGGLFNTFIAPALFNTVTEYPLLLLASLLVISPLRPLPSRRAALLMVLAASAAAALFWFGSEWLPARRAWLMLLVVLAFTGVAALYLAYRERTLHYVLCLSLIALLAPPLYTRIQGERVAFTDRNVFGVSRVIWMEDLNAWQFRHGTTNHGIQSADAASRLKPVAYYTPLKQVFAALPPALQTAPVGVMGMGVGTVACYGKPAQRIDFFEIDPLVDLIARRHFTYLSDCPPVKQVEIGDGRLGLARAPEGEYGLIVADAFSSDSIPIHLLTREAVEIYAARLKPGGLLAFNVSNRNIDLLPVLSAVADAAGMKGVYRFDIPPPEMKLAFPSQWVVLAREESALKPLGWEALPAPDARFLWRDDYSNILRSVRF